MIRLLHLVAITMLIASAAYAYSTKYETLYYAETLVKTKAKRDREREAIAVAKAEWALLTRPDRLQRMVDRHLDLKPMGIAQLVRLSDLPAKPSKGDAIGAKLETLGVEPGTTGSLKGGSPSRVDPIGAKLDALSKNRPAAKSAKAKPAEPNTSSKPSAR
ncbi:hypothetical protein [uncultured Enterovirga sp.]|uniref:cell division protein FtsL n=1 Tax=uncultured Enterovirga sp. TaxID=2026352 RepID=UPI0035CB02B4